MKKITSKLFFLLCFFFINSYAFADVLKKIEVSVNKRISSETIKVYGEIQLNKDYQNDDINDVIKKLYNTNFFSNISTNFSNGVLKINVTENPIIYSIEINGEKAKKFKEEIFKMIYLKEKSSYIENFVKTDVEIIKNFYNSLGYYSVNVDVDKQKSEAGENTLNLIFNVDKGERSKIKKIYFIGDKKIKDRTLRNVIISEENRFWKFVSKKKYLNQSLIERDRRLLTNFYLDKGYYNVDISSTSANNSSTLSSFFKAREFLANTLKLFYLQNNF